MHLQKNVPNIIKTCTSPALGAQSNDEFKLEDQEKVETGPMLEEWDPSPSMFSSPEVICRVSDSDSRLDFPWPASAGPSDDKGNAALPEEDPNKRRTTGTSDEDVEKPYVGPIGMGWSNLQFGPYLQIP